ncbi:hypothetical protein [Paenibacillus amylolyticus]|uniref:hypothetical protein n=1 Tax=Paenibacillus amylolyticus TaxID=1451 RepID=UPI0021000CA6|nr:hypothetical protein [Paenibacillus amylolyticus]
MSRFAAMRDGNICRNDLASREVKLLVQPAMPAAPGIPLDQAKASVRHKWTPLRSLGQRVVQDHSFRLPPGRKLLLQHLQLRPFRGQQHIIRIQP